jgi:hypothetical protein
LRRIGIRTLFYFVLIFIIIPFSLAGSEGENFERAARILKEANIPYEERSLLAGYGGFGQSLFVRNEFRRNTFQRDQDTGSGSEPGTFVLAVPLYAEFAVDTALALSEKLQNRNAVNNILIAFLGDEKNTLPRDQGGVNHKGLRDLLTLSDMPENWVLCYLDTDEKPGSFFIRHGGRGYIAPLENIKPLPSLFSSRQIPWSFKIRFNEIYKLGLVEGPEPLSIAWEGEINSFVLSADPKSKLPAENISAENMAGLFLEYTDSLNFPVLNADRHYFTFATSGGNFFYISEGQTDALLLFVTGFFSLLFLIYSAKYNAVLLLHFRLFFKRIWIFFLLLPALAVSLKFSGALYSGLFFLLKQSSADAASAAGNYAGAGLIAVFAALLFFLPSPALALIRFPRREHFYGFSAVLFVIMGMFISAFLDFSYIRVFLWTFFFTFLGAFLSNPIQVFLCLLLIPIFPVSALLNMLESCSGVIAGYFINPGWEAAFQTALVSLPFFLIGRRGTILFQNKMRRGINVKPNRKYRLIAVPVMLVVVFGIMAVQISSLKDPAIRERRLVCPGDGKETKSNESLSLSKDDLIFQDSRIITLAIRAAGTPVRFDVSLESGDGESLLPVYSATVPFEPEDDGKKINFTLGERPPNPLILEIVLPRNFAGILKAAAVYNAWDPEIDPGERPDTEDYVLKIEKRTNL